MKQIAENLKQVYLVSCANNHLYPIYDSNARNLIFKANATVGGKLSKMNVKQRKEEETPNDNETKTETIHILYEDMNTYALIDRVNNMDGCHRIIMTRNGDCNSLFNAEINRGNIHNSKVKTSKSGGVVKFNIRDVVIDKNNTHHDHYITIEENEHYNDIQITIDTLNQTSTKDKYIQWPTPS